MSKKLFLLVAINVLWANDEPLVENYGKNLYENPRGIACNKCHGNKGEGGVIAHYKHKGVMPRYFLTDEEITAIYMYLYRP